MTSADSCPITVRVTPHGAALSIRFPRGSALLVCSPSGARPAGWRLDLVSRVSDRHLSLANRDASGRLVGQASPDKVVSLPCTTAPFTVSPASLGFAVWCRLASGHSAFYGISVRRLAGLPPASFGPGLAATPLPSARGWRHTPFHGGDTPTGDLHPIDSRPCRAYTRQCS